MKFEYDPRKNSSNIKKHTIDFEEAISVFEDPLLLIWEDTSKSIGRTFHCRREIYKKQNLTRLVVHCIRSNYENKEIIRIASARKVTGKERKLFEEL